MGKFKSFLWYGGLKKINSNFLYSNNAAKNSATHAGFSCPFISMVQLKVTLIPLSPQASISLTELNILSSLFTGTGLGKRTLFSP